MKSRVSIDDVDDHLGDLVLYRSEPFTGILYELDIDGELLYEGEHTNGFPSGYSRVWWRPGILKSEIIYRHKNNPYSKSTEWYANGIMKELEERLESTLIRYQKWNDKGILIERWETLNEDDYDIFAPQVNPVIKQKLHGTNTQWYDNASIKEVHSSLKGKLIKHQKWDMNGNLIKDWEIDPQQLDQLQSLCLPND